MSYFLTQLTQQMAYKNESLTQEQQYHFFLLNNKISRNINKQIKKEDNRLEN